MQIKKVCLTIALGVCLAAGSAGADVVGAVTMDFVDITGQTSNFRMAQLEVTNGQWDALIGGSGGPANEPKGYLDFKDAALFINALNTAGGYQPAYNFVAGAFATWSAVDAAGGTNLYRHKDAVYFLPTDDEWKDAAHWTGSVLQSHATPSGAQPTQAEANWGSSGPWAVGSGALELNGTYDMQGNVVEIMENFANGTTYPVGVNTAHRARGGSWGLGSYALPHTFTYVSVNEDVPTPTNYFGMRVASVPMEIPEPATMSLLALSGLALLRRKK